MNEIPFYILAIIFFLGIPMAFIYLSVKDKNIKELKKELLLLDKEDKECQENNNQEPLEYN